MKSKVLKILIFLILVVLVLSESKNKTEIEDSDIWDEEPDDSKDTEKQPSLTEDADVGGRLLLDPIFNLLGFPFNLWPKFTKVISTIFSTLFS